MIQVPASALPGKYSPRPGIYEYFGLPPFPFRCRLSFASLIRRWETLVDGEDVSDAVLAGAIMEQLERAPEFREPIDDLSVLDRNADLVDLLVCGFLPSLKEEKELLGLSLPFNNSPFFQSPTALRILNHPEVKMSYTLGPDAFYQQILTYAFNLILHRQYGQPFVLQDAYTFEVRLDDPPFHRFYQAHVDYQFVELVPLRPLPELSSAQLRHLMENLGNNELFLQTFDPDTLEFQGLVASTFFDVTKTHTISELEVCLMERDALTGRNPLSPIEQQLRSYFQLPDLRLGITIHDFARKGKETCRFSIWKGLLPAEHYQQWSTESPLLAELFASGKIKVLENLTEQESADPSVEALSEKGIASVVLAPLTNKEKEIIGLLELGSPHPGDFSRWSPQSLHPIVRLFGIAAERSRMEIDNQLEAIIRREFTAIHPSIEWRFAEIASHILHRQERELGQMEIEPIIFRDVYPFYAQADIVGSTAMRNQAIREDLVRNLREAERVLRVSHDHSVFPLAGELLLEAGARIEALQNEINSNNELSTARFLVERVHPFLQLLRDKSPAIEESVQKYLALLDPEWGIVYDRRKAYEESVARINEASSFYLDRDQQKAQQIIPHFYEKYQTDGVAYNMYVGQSLWREGRFEPRIHLPNLQLWQLLSLCRITWKLGELKARLPTPLSTAQLILVHSSPLSIRFRMDEKRFDVDGTYNAHYEIVKKRIDKAYLKGTDERLTQEGKIAVVMQQELDERSYRQHFRYLLKKGFIVPPIEEVELETMQGVFGLRAIRLQVAPTPPSKG